MKKGRYIALTVGSTIPGVGWGPGPNKKKKVCWSPAFISPLSNRVATWPAASLSSRCAPPWWTVCLPIRSQNKPSFFKLLWLDVFLQQQEKQLMHKAQAAPWRDSVEKTHSSSYSYTQPWEIHSEQGRASPYRERRHVYAGKAHH